MADEIFDSTDALEEFKALMTDPAARQAFVQLKAEQRDRGVSMRYEHILRAVSETPWAIRPAMLGVIVDILAFRAEGGRLTSEEISERIGGARRIPREDPPQGVAVLPVHGVIVPKAGLMSEVSGATSIEGLRQQFRHAMASPQVGTVVMDVDSPGGMVDGVPEMAAEIRAARGTKPIIAVANGEAASAAYWLATQADKVVVTKSSRIGSIGVFTAHEDQSQQDEKKGVKTTLISAGKFKTEGNPFEPLSEEARAHMQSLVDQFYNMFVSDVAAGRNVTSQAVRGGFGQGRVVGAKDAVDQGMADEVGSLEGVISAALSRRTLAASDNPHLHGVSMTTAYPNAISGTVSPNVSVSILPTISVDVEADLEAGNVPRTEEGMRSHLMSQPPEGHGRSGGSVMKMSLQEMNTSHAQAHSGSSPEHQHGDMKDSALEENFEETLARQPGADNSAWDGNRAMGECSSAADYAAICAGEHSDGTPDQRQHWALPHHYLGKVPTPNANGVRNALARIPTTQSLSNRAKAESHLNSHMRQINPNASAAELEEEIVALRTAYMQGKDLSVVRPAGPPDPGEKAEMRARLQMLSE